MERKGESPEEKEGYYELIETGREQRSRERRSQTARWNSCGRPHPQPGPRTLRLASLLTCLLGFLQG